MATFRFWVNNHAHIVKGNKVASPPLLSYSLAILSRGRWKSFDPHPVD